ncbi:phage tail tape measure protein [Aurantimonas aggregata]|uniref:Phage tail tape measure protein n=1 Tax=Aurantimonas aggregata TaxID=2047720 RepID=A0A6L9MM83_9HYPH|nr:phage tail tape measure protein [Aurantimonas aggregata]NDV88812.1 phage tail tape measure protein [Aurantimonas aggregata]
MATLTSQLILSLIDRVTAPARGIAGAVDNLQGRLAANNRQMDAMRGRMVEAVAVAGTLAYAIGGPIRAAMEFESAMADVRKVVDFPTPTAFKEMGADIIEMSTRLPIAAEGIAAIVAEAGQSDIAREELLGFAEIASKVSVAWDMAAGDTGKALAEIKTQLSLSVAGTSELADVINHLSNTSASAAPDLVEYMKRIASVGEMGGFTSAQTAALGSAMIASGAEAEVAATSFRNVVKMMSRGNSAAKSQVAAFRDLGMHEADVAKAFGKDPVAALREVLVALSKIEDPAKRMTTAFGAFGEEARGFMPLIANIELYDKALAAVSRRSDYLGSSQREYEERAKTSANAMQLFANKATAAGIAIGSALLPALNGVMDALGPLALAIARFADANPRLTSTVVALTAGLVALRVASLAAQFSFFWMRGAYLATAIAGLKGIGGALGAVTAAASLFGRRSRAAGQAAFTGFSMAARSADKAAAASAASARMIAGMSGVGNAAASTRMIAGMTAASGALVPAAAGVTGALAGVFTAFVAGLAGITAPVWLLVGGIVLAVAGIAASVYKYWVPISEFFSGFASVIGEALSGAISAISDFGSQLASAVGSWAKEKLIDFGVWLGFDEAGMRAGFDAAKAVISAGISDMIAMVKAIPGQIGNWFGDLFEMNQYSEHATAEFRSAGERMAQALVGALAGLPGKIVAAIGSTDLAGIASGLVADIKTIPGRITAALANIDMAAPFRTAFQTLGAIPVPGFDDLIAIPGRIASAFANMDMAAPVRVAFDAMQNIIAEIVSFFTNLTIPAPSFENVVAAFSALVAGIRKAVTAIEGLVRRASRAVSSIGAFGSTAAGAGSANANPLQPIMPGDVPAIDAARAAGGAIAGGRTYLVGEEGPELITPNRSGFVHPADETAGMMVPRGRGGGGASTGYAGTPVINLGGITINPGPGMDEAALAEKTARAIDKAIRDAFSGGHWNGGYRVA